MGWVSQKANRKRKSPMNITMIVFLLAGLVILPVYQRVNDRGLTLSVYGRFLLGVMSLALGVSLFPTLSHFTHLPVPAVVTRVCGVYLILTMAMVSETLGFGYTKLDTVCKVSSILLIPALLLFSFC
jgi:sugar phosphate permease